MTIRSSWVSTVVLRERIERLSGIEQWWTGHGD